MNLKSEYLPTRSLFDTLSDDQISADGGKAIVRVCYDFQINNEWVQQFYESAEPVGRDFR